MELALQQLGQVGHTGHQAYQFALKEPAARLQAHLLSCLLHVFFNATYQFCSEEPAYCLCKLQYSMLMSKLHVDLYSARGPEVARRAVHANNKTALARHVCNLHNA